MAKLEQVIKDQMVDMLERNEEPEMAPVSSETNGLLKALLAIIQSYLQRVSSPDEAPMDKPSDNFATM